jgi:hypothetical protein
MAEADQQLWVAILQWLPEHERNIEPIFTMIPPVVPEKLKQVELVIAPVIDDVEEIAGAWVPQPIASLARHHRKDAV